MRRDFGRVPCLIFHRDEAQAAEIANDTDYVALPKG
ncbi:hypothetical protein J2X65_001893 [Ancylobacter sp. 3268]|nr:hypothetical protein [Ancylobacter sp. 3268]